MNNARADILLRRSSGEILAIVDVKNLPKLTIADAVKFREALQSLAPGDEPARYLLLISQNRGFIWRGEAGGGNVGRPEQFEMTPILRHYLTDAELERHLRGAELEIAVAHWLADLSRGQRLAHMDRAASEIMSSFLTDVRGAEVELEALI